MGCTHLCLVSFQMQNLICPNPTISCMAKTEKEIATQYVATTTTCGIKLMPYVSRDNDTAGGDFRFRNHIKANDELIIVDGDGVAGHGIAPIFPNYIADLQSTVKIGGVDIVIAGDDADVCGELATGSDNVNIN